MVDYFEVSFENGVAVRHFVEGMVGFRVLGAEDVHVLIMVVVLVASATPVVAEVERGGGGEEKGE